MRPLPETITDLVWLATGFIGDVVLTTAGSELGRRYFPNARHHFITTPVGAKALAHARGISSLTIFDKRGKSTVAAFKAVRDQLLPKLAKPNGTVLLQAHRSFRSSLLARHLGLFTISYTEADFNFFAARTVDRVALLHEAARISLLLEPLGVPRYDIAHAKPVLSPPGLRSEIVALLPKGEGDIVAIAPGSVWGTKRWTAHGFIELSQKYLADGRRIVLVGSQAEEAVAAEIHAALSESGDRVANLAGRTAIEDLPALFRQCALLISNDSSPIHFASAVDLRTIGVFGATVPTMGFGPLATGSSTVGITLPCRPCSDHGPMVCPLGHFRCMKDLSADTVYERSRAVPKDN